ncbi:class I SAM-dependent methyltransferase [Spirosoma areae]
MKRVILQEDWKESWKYSYPYDLLEVYGESKKNFGYRYAYENRRDHALALIQRVAKKGDKILDVAAAQGNFSLKLAEMGYEVTWNDIRAELADYVRMKHEFGAIDYKVGNVFDVKFDHLFDVVLATEIIEHVAHPDEFMHKLSKLIKPDGYIVISTPLGSYFKNSLPKFTTFEDASVFESKQFGPNSDGHIFLLHLDEIRTLAERAGLEVVAVSYYNNPLTSGHIKLEKVLAVLPKKLVFTVEKLTQKLPLFIGEKIHTNFCVLLKPRSS